MPPYELHETAAFGKNSVDQWEVASAESTGEEHVQPQSRRTQETIRSKAAHFLRYPALPISFVHAIDSAIDSDNFTTVHQNQPTPHAHNASSQHEFISHPHCLQYIPPPTTSKNKSTMRTKRLHVAHPHSYGCPRAEELPPPHSSSESVWGISARSSVAFDCQ